MIDRRVDEDVGIIYVTAEGHWSPTEVDEHYDQLRLLIDRFRKEGRRVRVLSDISAAPRQSAEVEQRSAENLGRTYRSGDRVAILTGNEEDRGHVRTLLGNIEIALFCSRLAAEMWLLHDRMEAPVGR